MDELVRHLAGRYSAGAESYKRYWLPLLAPMGEHLLDLLHWTDTKWLLDVGAGTGGLIPALNQRSPSSRIIGIDISRGMLALAPRSTNVLYAQMDARQIALRSELIDIALLAFVLFHYPDIRAGLQELMRALRPGGAVGSAVFHTSPDFEAKKIWDAVLAEEVEKTDLNVVDLNAVDNTDATNRAEKSKMFFNSAGFTEIRTTEKAYTYQWAPDAYRAFRSGFGSSGEIFRSLPVGSQAYVVSVVQERFSRLPTSAFRYEPVVLYTTAKKPA
ncbi:MAG: class I SAM-dependent methyltransferase [Anaerolineales bacterium]|jgi:ubiquinone/menaquinone biosynthesis C-methylase UbiE